MNPWAFIAHRDGYWAGVASAEMSAQELKNLLGGWVMRGFTVTPVYSREDYQRTLARFKYWHTRDKATGTA